jgi:hypothetical protein
MLKLLLLFFYLSTTAAYHGKPVIWNRIIQFQVNDRVTDFLNKQGINNCYEHEESRDNLHLKCWIDNELVTVDIKIFNNDDSLYI